MMAGFSTDNPGAQPSCPICGTADAASYALAADRLLGIAKGVYRLFRCRSCGCIFQHPLPEPAALAAYYPRDYWWAQDRSSRVALAVSRIERAYREHVTLDHVRFLERCASGRVGFLLDVGCGTGLFLHLAQQRGFLPHGMDISEHAVAAAQDQYHLDVRQGGIGSDVWADCRFDVITMFHVLEHLPDPAKALAFARGLLKPGGRLIVQVPNAASFQARIFGARWYGLDVPRHLINFTPHALALLFEQAGFSSRIASRFSLRDNPASLASSLAVGMDPIGRRGRGRRSHAVLEGMVEICYFGLVLLSLPPTLIESCCGRGATLWVHAWCE